MFQVFKKYLSPTEKESKCKALHVQYALHIFNNLFSILAN